MFSLLLLDCLYSENFSSRFTLPVAPLLKRPVKFDRSRDRTFVYTGAAVPAFVRVQNNRGFTFFVTGNVDIYRTYFNASVAPVASFGKNHGLARCNHVRKSIYFFFSHWDPPLCFIGAGIVFIVGFVVFCKITPVIKR